MNTFRKCICWNISSGAFWENHFLVAKCGFWCHLSHWGYNCINVFFSQKAPDEIFQRMHFLNVLIEPVDLAYHNLLRIFLLLWSSGPRWRRGTRVLNFRSYMVVLAAEYNVRRRNGQKQAGWHQREVLKYKKHIFLFYVLKHTSWTLAFPVEGLETASTRGEILFK